MKPLLDRLFSGEYSVSDLPPSPEYEKLYKHLNTYLDQLVKIHGMKFTDELLYAASATTDQLQKQAFREGVRFGYQLTLELLERDLPVT